MRKFLKTVVVVAMLGMLPAQAAAGDYEVENVMDDALYGAGIGALIGLGMVLVSDKPLDNGQYIIRGTGIGIIAGAAYGMYQSSQALAQLEDGHIKLGIPSPQFALQSTASGLALVVKTDLIRGTF